MKKLIVLLLALAMVGAVSAQVTTAIGLYGQVDLVNEAGQGVLAPWGNGYDTWTFKAQDKDGKFGFSITDQNILSQVTVLIPDGSDVDVNPDELKIGGFDIRDWTVWGKVLGGKLSVGLLRDATFRLTLPLWNSYTLFGGTDRVSGNGLFYVNGPKNGLSFGVNLPYGTTAANTVDVLKKADLGVKYDIKNVGTAFALMDLNLVTPANVLNAGFKFTGVKNLTATAIVRAAFDANLHKAALGMSYTGVDKLTAYAEAAVVSTAGVITYSAVAQGTYDVTDVVSATLAAFYGSAGYDVWAAVAYDLGAGFSAEASVGFDSAVWAAATVYYAVSL
ncbi:MAG: hypothetical protein AB1407_09935 [Spirochaetota bacterium]